MKTTITNLTALFAMMFLINISAFGQTKVTMVEFGASAAQNIFSTQYPTWNTVLMSSNNQYVSSASPVYKGVTEKAGVTNGQTTYAGIKGTTAINFKYGQRIVATFYNRSSNRRLLRVSISLTDENDMVNATWSAPWFGMYSYYPGNEIQLDPNQTYQLFYNITNSSTILSPNSVASEGNHTCINISRQYYGGDEGSIVLSKIELWDDADITPPNAPVNLVAQPISMVAGQGNHAVKLTWQRPTDPTTTQSSSSGVSRYFIYRNNVLFDCVDELWSTFFGANVEYIDNSVKPGQTYTYKVTAIDKAIAGRYPSYYNYSTQRHGNEGAAATVSITMPSSYNLTSVINPFTDLEYQGCIKMPAGLEYSGQSMTFYPEGNPGYNAATHLPGALYLIGHDQKMEVAKISIPLPKLTKNTADMNTASYLIPLCKPWPQAYTVGGQPSIFPAGSVATCMGLGYHPGKNGVGKGLYYSTFWSYSGDVNAKCHGFIDPDFKNPKSPWGLKDQDNANQLLPFYYSARFMFAVPQDYADANFGGKSLISGLGWQISGHGWPSCGPTFYASAPWESGSLPAANSTISSTKLMRFGATGDVAKWSMNWNQSSAYFNASWMQVNQKKAIAMSTQVVIGDNWYGGENGEASCFIDLDAPRPNTGSMQKGQANTRQRSVIMFYNPDDLAAIAKGTKQANEIKPYAYLNIDDLMLMAPNSDWNNNTQALAIDNNNGYLYCFERGTTPVIHVWKIKDGSTGLYHLTVNSGTGTGNYAAATKVNISADAAPAGKIFDQWTGDVTGIADTKQATTTITINSANAAITATYKNVAVTQYTLTVSSGTGGGNYAAGTSVTVTANTAPAGKIFDQWTGSISGLTDKLSPSTTLIMPSANTTITATYKTAPVNTFSLTVSSGTGSGSYAAGVSVTITANAAPAGKVFDQWTGSITGLTDKLSPSTTLIMPSANTTITATYKTAPVNTFSLTVSSGTGSGNYAAGVSVTITANAAPAGKVFDQWTGSITGITNKLSASTTLTMPSSNITISASYKTIAPATYTLTVINGTGSGTYTAGTKVTISANVPVGKSFDKWIGATSGITNINSSGTTFTMSAVNATINATFKTGTGIEGDDVSEIGFYPNPATDYIIIRKTNDENVHVQLYDITGRIIIDDILSSEMIDISNVKSGIYIIVIGNDEKCLRTTVIKQ